MKKCYWIGPTGFNPLAGDVVFGKTLSLSEENFNRLFDQNLVTPDDPNQTEKPKKKKT